MSHQETHDASSPVDDAASDTSEETPPEQPEPDDQKTANSADSADTGENNAPLPTDAAGWRTLLGSVPARDLFRLVQEDRRLAARLFAGFRPNVALLQHPIVLSRLVEDAQKQTSLGEKLASLYMAVAPSTGNGAAQETQRSPEDDAEGNGEDGSAEEPALPTIAESDASLNGRAVYKETIKKQKAAIKERDQRIQELQAQIADLQKERDTVRTEVETARNEIKTQKAALERERRLRERQEKRLEKQSAKTEPSEPPAKSAAAPPVTAAASVAPTAVGNEPSGVTMPLSEAMERLLHRGKYVVVAEVCQEALAAEATQRAALRGRIHALFAEALYGIGEIAGGEEQLRAASVALLDSGQIVPAARAMARLLTQTVYYNPATPPRSSDGATLRRLLLLAERDGMAQPVREVFTRMRIGSAAAGRRLQETLKLGGKKTATLVRAALGDPEERKTVLGPDEPVALPTTSGVASTVTARQIARAVDEGNLNFVRAVRHGLEALRQRSPADAELADALLEGVTMLDSVAVIPLLYPNVTPAVVDASNVARHTPDPLALNPPLRVESLLLMRDYLLRQRFFPVLMIADATLRFHADDRAAYERLLDRHIVREAPPGTSADEALLTEARLQNAPLISNDRFTEWGDAASGIDRRGFFIANNRVSLV
ncbi:MAG: hypothetical protein OHK0029_01600 [Armatimonadaceae bacterium]